MANRVPYRVAVGLVLATCTVAIALGPWRRLEAVEQGKRLVSEGAYIRAARLLARVVALSPQDARAHYYLGLAYGGIGQRGASRTHLEEAVRLRPADARFHDALGRAYRGAGNTARALGEFQEAVRRQPHTPRYQVGLAGLLVDQGRWLEAAARLRHVTRTDPGAPDIRLLLADVLKRAGDREGMKNEYREVMRLADGTALGELARQELRAAFGRAGDRHEALVSPEGPW